MGLLQDVVRPMKRVSCSSQRGAIGAPVSITAALSPRPCSRRRLGRR
jgi:hypothetical protein